MTELTIDQHLQLLKLELEKDKLFYFSYPKGASRNHYIQVALENHDRRLKNFYKKWGIDKL